MAEFGAKSATDGDRLLPQIGGRIIALHAPLFDPEADLQGTLDVLGKVICEKIATQLDNRRDSDSEPYRTMSEDGFPRTNVSEVDGYFPAVARPSKLRLHLITGWQHQMWGRENEEIRPGQRFQIFKDLDSGPGDRTNKADSPCRRPALISESQSQWDVQRLLEAVFDKLL